MVRYILKRILLMIPVLLGVTVLIFTVMYFVPGDIATIVLGAEATAAQKEAYLEMMGLKDPYIVQLGRYVANVWLHFDFGTSYIQNTSVAADILQRFPRTLAVASGTVFTGFAVGIPLGIVAAVNRNKFIDRFALIISLIGISMPSFWLAILLVILFSLKLKWLPSQGIGGFKYYILPCISNAAAGLAGNVRLTRTSMLEVIRSDYVTTAQAKGVSQLKVIVKHALPNAMINIVTAMGTAFGAMIGGTLIIETVFSIPGIGSYMIKGINSRDYYAVEGSVIFVAFMFGIIMLLVDLLYAFIDPRVKAQYEGSSIKRGKKNGKKK